MANYIAIDGGTTNTKIFLVCDNQIMGNIVTKGVKYNNDNNNEYKAEIKNGISQLLKDNNLCESDITKILCSGMITSETGLCPLKHLETPCGISEMADGMYETKISDVSSLPFVFIRGVKTKAERFENADMMRGEETEFAGIAEADSSKSIYVFPGTHSKIIRTDNQGRISDFSTEFTGELIEVISKNSILKSSIDMSCTEFSEEYLTRGYKYATEKGLNSALFKVRVLGNLFDGSKEEVYSFFIGAVLSAEINNIIKTQNGSVVIVGKHPLCIATEILLNACSDKKVIRLFDERSSHAAVYGMIKIYETKGL